MANATAIQLPAAMSIAMHTRSNVSNHGPALQPLAMATAANVAAIPQTTITIPTIAAVLVTSGMIARGSSSSSRFGIDERAAMPQIVSKGADHQVRPSRVVPA